MSLRSGGSCRRHDPRTRCPIIATSQLATTVCRKQAQLLCEEQGFSNDLYLRSCSLLLSRKFWYKDNKHQIYEAEGCSRTAYKACEEESEVAERKVLEREEEQRVERNDADYVAMETKSSQTLYARDVALVVKVGESGRKMEYRAAEECYRQGGERV